MADVGTGASVTGIERPSVGVGTTSTVVGRISTTVVGRASTTLVGRTSTAVVGTISSSGASCAMGRPSLYQLIRNEPS